MNWKPTFAIVLFGITIITYWGAILFEKNKYRCKLAVTTFVMLGLLPLLASKYYNFLNDSFSFWLCELGIGFQLPGLNWAIPVGISFFTFQAVGYLLDVYHQRITAEKNFIDYLLFISFFPQITSGPISTGKEFLPQIKQAHDFSYIQGPDGLKLLLWGMFLKVVIADRVGMLVDTVYGNYSYYSGNACLLASFFYTIQIYCDFAGYSLMAIGIAKTLGFNLINNFHQPYFATSITDFWRRWHISLTRWLTTHVYIAMGGSRCSKRRQYWNIMVTFLVSGLWHGANWTFVFWGMLHGAFQIVEKFLGLDPKGQHAQSKILKSLTPIRIFTTFMLVNIAWIFFRMPSISDAYEVIIKILTERGSVDIVTIYNGAAPALIVLIGFTILLFHDLIIEYGIGKFSFGNHAILRWGWYIMLFILVLSIGVLDGGQFIYVSF